MSLNCGIVGLPNVGKSTIFQALTSAPAEAANYPFCTIEPNVGVVGVPDTRLKKIADIFGPLKTIPAIVEFVDIAGLVKGASKGEGLGNQFLGHIRQVGAIAHVVRCFDDNDIIHVDGSINPLRDIEVINLELALADLESVEKRLGTIDKAIKSQDKKVSDHAKALKTVLIQLQEHLATGKMAKAMALDVDEKKLLTDLHLITMKETLFVCNVDEEGLHEDNEYVKIVKGLAEKEGSHVIKISGKIESEISNLESEEEKKEFLADMGVEKSGLETLIQKGYEILGFKTYFTAGEKEVRAWTYPEGSTAPEAAAVIHTDFQKGFIKAEIYHCDELFNLGSEQKIKETGKMRIEGKEYIMKDGDVVHFRFNV